MEFNDKQIEILQVAEKLFAEEGFDGASVREIAKQANINIAMISYYFGSKEKLLESLLVYRVSSIKLHLENLIQSNLTPFQKIDELVAFYIKRIYQNRSIYQIIHFELSNKKRELNLELFTQVKNDNFNSLKKIIEEGQQKGVFQNNINIELISPIIIGSLTNISMNKPYYMDLLNFKSEEEFENYIHTTFTKHIQKTIKALLIYEE